MMFALIVGRVSEAVVCTVCSTTMTWRMRSTARSPAATSTPEHPFRMTALDSFHPARNASDSAAPAPSSAPSTTVAMW